jgi:hypothetical protein
VILVKIELMPLHSQARPAPRSAMTYGVIP